MTSATITPAATTPADVQAAITVLSGAELDAAITAIRARWSVADASETETRALFDAADIAWQNARVCKVRVAYAAAMLAPVKGEPNLLNAARVLLTDPADNAATRTKQAKSRKNTLRNYVDAGAALHTEALAYSITEPTEQEREIVAAAFKAGNKRDKDAAKELKNAGKGEGETSTPRESDPSGPATQADVINAVEALQSIVAQFTRDHGFAGVVADNIAEVLAEIGAQIDAHRVDGGDV